MDYPLNVLCNAKYLPYMIIQGVLTLGDDKKSVIVNPALTSQQIAGINARLERALNELDTMDYKIIWLIYYSEFTHHEVSQYFNGIPQSRIDTAIQNMHAVLSREGQLRFIVYGDKEHRLSKDLYYLNIADAISLRATCLRRRYGAVIVKNDEIISSGYNGAPRGRCNCTDLGVCLRKSNNIPAGQRYELCRSVHAECNAIISAHRDEMIGATLYLYGRDADSNEPLAVTEPCAMCKRMIINAGITKVVAKDDSGDIVETKVSNWVKDDDSLKLESLL